MYRTENDKTNTIYNACKKGYTDIYLAFATVRDLYVSFEGEFDAYTQWVNGVNVWEQNMIADIQRAKSEGLLQNLYVSVGGANNTFFITGNVTPAQLASSVLKFMQKFGANGFDFDLEDMGLTDAQYAKLGDYISLFIDEIKK